MSSPVAEGLPARFELHRLLSQRLREEERLHPAPQPHRPEHGRRTRQNRLLGREARVGDLVGRSSGDSGGDRHRHQAGAHAVPGIRGPARQRRPELGLEPGGQQPAPQRRGQRQLPTVQQCPKVPGRSCFQSCAAPLQLRRCFKTWFNASARVCLQIGERIRVILDMDDKTLAFERGFEFLGVAFRGLPKACLFPAVSAVYGNTEVTMVYLGKPLDG